MSLGISPNVNILDPEKGKSWHHETILKDKSLKQTVFFYRDIPYDNQRNTGPVSLTRDHLVLS